MPAWIRQTATGVQKAGWQVNFLTAEPEQLIYFFMMHNCWPSAQHCKCRTYSYTHIHRTHKCRHYTAKSAKKKESQRRSLLLLLPLQKQQQSGVDLREKQFAIVSYSMTKIGAVRSDLRTMQVIWRPYPTCVYMPRFLTHSDDGDLWSSTAHIMSAFDSDASSFTRVCYRTPYVGYWTAAVTI